MIPTLQMRLLGLREVRSSVKVTQQGPTWGSPWGLESKASIPLHSCLPETQDSPPITMGKPLVRGHS